LACLIDDVGQYRNTGVGIMKGKKVIHMAPSAERVNGLMFDLFDWLACSDEHLLASFNDKANINSSLLISPLMIEINCFT
jgi:hypothetical protein